MKKALEWIAQRRKAVVGFVAPGVGLIAADLAANGHIPTAHQWEAAAVACVLTAVGVERVSNKQKVAQP